MKNLFSISKLFSFLLLLLALLIVSCQKENDLQPETNAQAETQADIPPLALEKLIVENAVRIPVEALSDEEILAYYEEYMQSLSEEDRTSLIAAVEEALSVGYTSSTDALNFRTTETMLSAGIPDDAFGQSVATVGNKVYVGARNDQKVYEYAKTGGSYTLINEIFPGEDSDDFGYRISVSGSWMAVAAPANFPISGPGKVFMYKKQGNTWVQKAVLSGPADETVFGYGLVLEGSTLAVSSLGNNIDGDAISIFKLNGNNWTLSETIKLPGYQWFEIDMDSGGNRIVGTGPKNGLVSVRATIFVRQGSNWVLEDEVTINPPAALFSRDVAIHNNTVVLTAFIPGNKHFVLTNNAGDWVVTQELTHPSMPPQNRFVEMSGEKIVIGAASNLNFISDAVYVFEKSAGAWSLAETLTMSDNGADKRIWSVAISGNTIVAGLTSSVFGGPQVAGSASVFE